jgi:hypothetical protein
MNAVFVEQDAGMGSAVRNIQFSVRVTERPLAT